MRVILSRKGFDSGYGGVPSPMLPDGRMISLPIPDRDASISYAEVQRDGISLGDLASDLTRGFIRPDYRAHLDPDLDSRAVARRPGWRPIFDQQAAALGHLRHEGAGPGDLFLFFGLFRHADYHRGHWRFVRGSQRVHAIWGWMLIGAVYSCRNLPANVARWAEGHPHLHGARPDENDVFVPANDLHVGEQSLPAAGLFTADVSRVLAAPGASPSRWLVPSWMHPDAGHTTLTYHKDPSRWQAADGSGCRLDSVGKGQEFVLNTPRQDLLAGWLARIFANV